MVSGARSGSIKIGVIKLLFETETGVIKLLFAVFFISQRNAMA